MAVINSIIEQGLVDHDYVANYTVGFEELKERASTRTPEWAEAINGIPAADIRKFARELATSQPVPFGWAWHSSATTAAARPFARSRAFRH